MPKFSQIAAAGAPPAVTDQALFLTGGTTDNLVTVTQLAAGLPAFTAALKGSVPASGGGTTNFLRADATWAAPPTTVPGGANTQFQFNNLGAFGGTVGYTWDSTNQAATLASIANPAASTLTLTGGTGLTTSQPVLNMTQTWNAGGVTFTGAVLNITNTASAAGSLLMDLQIAGATRFNVAPSGNITIPGGVGIASTGATGFIVTTSASQAFAVQSNTANAVEIGSGFVLGFSSGAPTLAPDTSIARVAAKVLEVGDGGANANAWIQTAGDLRLGSDVGFTSNVVLATIMSVPLQAGRSYAFDVYLSVTGSAGGVQAAMVASGGLTATAIQYDGYVVDNAAAGTKGAAQASALGTVVANPATITGPASASIRGLITVNVAGTIQIQASQSTSSATTTTVKRGSWAFFRDTP